jgi:hypothetical protein
VTVQAASLCNVRRVQPINPVAKALALSRRRASVTRNRKKYDRKRDKNDAEKDYYLSQTSEDKSDSS